jgi:poly(ADP-ribose) glycohydrolase ARH3
MTREKFQGALLGLALGDALGASFEGGILERFVWRLIGKTRAGESRWTDDTQMAIDLVESLIAAGGVDQEDLAMRFARSYRWSRGYGPGAAKLLKRIGRGENWRVANRAVYRDGSYGNGGAMRAPVVGLYYSEAPELIPAATRQTAEITHAHPLGQEGAVLIAVATACGIATGSRHAILEAVTEHCRDASFRDRLEKARTWLEKDEVPPPQVVARTLGNGISAVESCITAVFLALSYLWEPFDNLITATIEGEGDTDTIGAMAGAIWGAVNGRTALPGGSLLRMEQCERLERLGAALWENRFARTNYCLNAERSRRMFS